MLKECVQNIIAIKLYSQTIILGQSLKDKAISFNIDVQGSPHLSTLYMRSFALLDIERRRLFVSLIKVSKSV
jgi:hypothetical protein